MKIRCRECKTIYDNREKYCPFCFTRTNSTSKSRVRIDGTSVQHKDLNKKVAKQLDTSDTVCCSERKSTVRPSSKEKKNKKKENQKSRVISTVVALLVILFQILMIFFE